MVEGMGSSEAYLVCSVVERVLVVAQQRAHGAGSLAVAASRYRRHPGGGSRSFVVASEASRDAVGRRDRAPAAWSAVRGGAAVAGGGHGCRRRIASSRRGQWGGAPSRWRRTEGWQQGREEEAIRVCRGECGGACGGRGCDGAVGWEREAERFRLGKESALKMAGGAI